MVPESIQFFEGQIAVYLSLVGRWCCGLVDCDMIVVAVVVVCQHCF